MVKTLIYYLLLITLFISGASNDFSNKYDNLDLSKVFATAGNTVGSITVKEAHNCYPIKENFETIFFFKKSSLYDLPQIKNHNYSRNTKFFIISFINLTFGARSPPFTFS